jgi:hypothetical protein
VSRWKFNLRESSGSSPATCRKGGSIREEEEEEEGGGGVIKVGRGIKKRRDV